MKIKGLLLSITLMFCAFVQLQAAPLDQKTLVGKWEYSAPTAPPMYTSGQINFSIKGEKLIGELIIEGQKVDFSEITIKEDEVTAIVYLESTPITVKFKMANQALEGKADTPDGPVKVTAVKK
jgi:hypothetical protein